MPVPYQRPRRKVVRRAAVQPPPEDPTFNEQDPFRSYDKLMKSIPDADPHKKDVQKSIELWMTKNLPRIT